MRSPLKIGLSKPRFGIPAENIFPVWEWVGGRYSLWSAIGLPIVLAIGMQNFRELLAGAYAMDQHFCNAPLRQNMPVILGLLSVWYNNFFHTQAHAILPYDQSLYLLPAYLQQAHMESSGKQVQKDGAPVDYATGAIIFGTPGTNGQHAFYQLLHQGTHLVPADFIVPVLSHYPTGEHQAILFASCLSQSKALMEGKTTEQVMQELRANGYSESAAQKLLPHKVLPGNRPSNTIVFPKLTPHTLGALLALYEHKIFTECAIWNINAFDQWSVELGKQLASNILPELTDAKTKPTQDASTNQLIAYYQKIKF
jgi:glucose-6-phosphate isomerase